MMVTLAQGFNQAIITSGGSSQISSGSIEEWLGHYQHIMTGLALVLPLVTSVVGYYLRNSVGLRKGLLVTLGIAAFGTALFLYLRNASLASDASVRPLVLNSAAAQTPAPAPLDSSDPRNYPPVVASISMNPPSPRVGQSVEFTVHPSGGTSFYSYTWTGSTIRNGKFDNRETWVADVPKPVVVYKTPGVKNVTLRVFSIGNPTFLSFEVHVGE